MRLSVRIGKADQLNTKKYTPEPVAGSGEFQSRGSSIMLQLAYAGAAQLKPRHPYPGKLGLVEEGALADLLLVDGYPISNIKLL